MGIGGGSFATDERIEFEVLVMLGGDIPDRMTIDSIEILPGNLHIQLNEIAPDWMHPSQNADTQN
ncbi:hypothetical protein [Burkholderia catarinensis]|uniref:hypothetical protein n=1 Tax=Burkholderia catarinensis TaxID=1108140 RepID=UPI001177B65B|nr:hypothetical protein [Burkholderia catarinensis]